MAATILTPARMDDWRLVLDRIDESINQALDQTAEYERALAADAVSAVAPDLSADGHVRGLRLHLDAATRLSDAVEALLAADEGEARAWAGLARHAAARLAIPPGARIS